MFTKVKSITFSLIICTLLLAFVSCVPIDDRIVNGTDALPGQIPYIVSFRKYDRHTCGGSIIDETHILTAAHCVIDFYPNDDVIIVMTVQYGVVDITTGENVINVTKATHHPMFSLGPGFKNDVAILTLERPLVFNEYVKPIALPTPNNATPENEPAVLSGWGYPDYLGNLMSDLQTVNITVYTDEDCERIHAETGPTDRKYHVCAGVPEGGKGQCSGDSGGPLVVNGVVVGVVSWSVKPCALKGYPGVFAKVSTQVDWVRSVINKDKMTEN